MNISATIITFNEEVHLAQCLESMRGIADELIVVDSGSLDRTQQIAESHGAKFFVRSWTNYSDQKNFASAQAAHEWILSVDADECLSSSLREELLELKQKQDTAVAYSFPRKAFYLGRWIDHSGWYPDYKTRLYKRGMAHWAGEFVHETLVVDGTTRRIEADLLHYTCRSVSAHAQSLDRYTSLAAQDLLRSRSPLQSLTVAGKPYWRILQILSPERRFSGWNSRLFDCLFCRLLQLSEVCQAVGTGETR